MQKKLRPFGVLNYEILNKKEAATGWCPKFMKYQRLKKKRTFGALNLRNFEF